MLSSMIVTEPEPEPAIRIIDFFIEIRSWKLAEYDSEGDSTRHPNGGFSQRFTSKDKVSKRCHRFYLREKRGIAHHHRHG